VHLCTFAANSIFHQKIIESVSASVRDFNGPEMLHVDRINCQNHNYGVGLNIKPNKRFQSIQKEIKQRLKMNAGIKRHFEGCKSLSINIGHDLKQSQFIQVSHSFKSLKVSHDFEVKQLHLLKKKAFGNYELIQSYSI